MKNAQETYLQAKTLMQNANCETSADMIGLMCFMIAIMSIATKKDTWNICDTLKEGSALAKDCWRTSTHAPL